MRQFTTTHTVYTFDELSKEAQAVAIENRRNAEAEYIYEWLGDDLQYKLEELLKENGISYTEPPKIYYSLGYSQGDGAMFEGTVTRKGYTYTIKQSGNYYHYNSKNIDIERNNGNNIPLKSYQKLHDAFDAIYVDICKELERYGYDCIETNQSDKNITEQIQSGNYEFYADGRSL